MLVLWLNNWSFIIHVGPCEDCGDCLNFNIICYYDKNFNFLCRFLYIENKSVYL